MGERVPSRSLYKKAIKAAGVGEKDTTKRAEQKAAETGKLDPLVDPAGFGVVRLSLPRVEDKGDYHEMLVGTPVPIETRVDTTGSMGGNVDVALKVLPDAFENWARVLPGYDMQVANGIFADVRDKFVLCRPQFEMDPVKIVNQLTLMVPERGGQDFPEDPDLGIFGGAYLTRAYINRIGLKGYDFTATDAAGRGRISPDTVTRVFGEQAFEKAAENGHTVSSRGAIDLGDVWSSLLDRAHAFVLQVDHNPETTSFWTDIIGKERLVKLPDTKYLPQVQAVIIGLTEGTLVLNGVAEFLQSSNMNEREIDRVAESVANIPIGAQAQLPSFPKRPVKGDHFAGKPDVWEDKNLWPIASAEADKCEVEGEGKGDDDEWI